VLVPGWGQRLLLLCTGLCLASLALLGLMVGLDSVQPGPVRLPRHRLEILLLSRTRSTHLSECKTIFECIILRRSGSSLLGELLSLHPASSYYFEPLAKVMYNLCANTQRMQVKLRDMSEGS